MKTGSSTTRPGRSSGRAAGTAALALAGLLYGGGDAARAAQVMDEVWFPKGSIRWGHTQTTPEIRRGICDVVGYFGTRTPIRFTEIPDMSRQGGLDPADELGALEIRYSEGIFNFGYGGQTKHYRKPNRGNKMVKLSFQHVKTRGEARSTLSHEMGHVLGFTHEFQRWDRRDNGVSVGAWAGRDPYNFGRPDRRNLRVLSPYDFQSQFATGYNAVDPTPRSPSGSLLSVHDVNAIWRVYGPALGKNHDGAVFGEDVASGDFDGDGYEDIAIAARFSEPGAGTGAVYFFKGVAQGPEEEGTGTTYVPWFRKLVAFAPGEKRRMVLATGDTHTLSTATTESPQGDGIDELILGLPGAGRVEIWIVNAQARFQDHIFTCGGEALEVDDDGAAPWGGHGVAKVLTIEAAEVGAARSNDFGAAIATGEFFGGNGDDLAIGAPKGSGVADPRLRRVAAIRRAPGGPVDRRVPAPRSVLPAVYLLPDSDPVRAVKIVDPASEATSEFGSALAVLEGFDRGDDGLVVGAPGAAVIDQPDSGKVYVYGAPPASGSPTHTGRVPASGTVYSPSVVLGDRKGTSVVAFTTIEEDAKTPEYWIAVGAPKARKGGTPCGEVELLSVRPGADPVRRGSITPRSCEADMRFGESVAVASGKCTGRSCPRNRTWIAVGSPHEDDRKGAVHVWDVWSGSQVTDDIADIWRWSTDGALFGDRIASIRADENGGGFVVVAKKAEIPVLERGAAPTTRTSGFAQVRLNEGGTSIWTSWSKILTPGNDTDTPPANR